MVIQNKRKDIFKKKNTARSIQIGLEVIEKEKKEKVLEIWVSTRGCIIYNTRKM